MYNVNEESIRVNTPERGYNDFGLCDTASIAKCILWHQLIPHKTRVLLPCLLRPIRVSASDITTLPVVRCNIIIQDVGYFENSALSSSLRKQAVHSFQVAIEIPWMENNSSKSNSKFHASGAL